VALLDGGIQAWLSAGLPPESSIIDPVPRTFRGKPGHRPQAEAAQILDARGSVLLDARAPERYRGEQEPIDPVAGHIPGARNLPAVSLVGADMRLKPAELRVLLSAAGAAKGTSATAYCGSGVTSALLVLAAEVAGVGPMRLYPGSWSEWIRDPKRPIAKGDE
jgi:thiosulfate/3-mercaptopyruvate sulfurtransferase